MTVPVQTPERTFQGDGASVEFPVTFRYADPTDLRALVRDSAGADTELTNGVDFTATDGDTPAGGTMTVTTAPIVGETLVIWRDTARSQDVDFEERGSFPAESNEGAIDVAIMILQEAAIAETRAMKVPRGEVGPEIEAIAGRANKIPRFDADGNFSSVSLAELAVLLDPEKQAGTTLAFTELAGPRSQAIIYNPDSGGVGEGGYWVEFSAQAATSFVRAYAKVFAGGGTCDVRVLAGSVQIWAATGVSSIEVDEVISATLLQGKDLIFVIENITGTVNGVVVKLEGAVA